MNPALPTGIVSNNQRITHELGSTHTVDVEDVAKLWRVYTTTKIILGPCQGRRLENLFWRIWSSGRINRSIRGSTLASLFANVTEEDNVIRTGPRSSRESVENVRTSPYRESRAPQTSTSPRSSQATQKVSKDRSSSRDLTPKHPGRAPVHLPPPILKKPPQSPDATPKAGRTGLLLSGSPGSDVQQHRGLSASPSPIASSTYGSQVTDATGVQQRPRRKKTSFAEGVTAVEGETMMPRVKMEPLERVAPGNGSPARARSSSPHPMIMPLLGNAIKRQIYPDADDSSKQPPPSLGRLPPTSNPAPITPNPPMGHGTILTYTHPSYDAPGLSVSPADGPHPPHPPFEEALVEKDFRTKFAEKRKLESRISSSASLAGSLNPAGHGYHQISPPQQQQQQQQQRQSQTSEQEYHTTAFPDMLEDPSSSEHYPHTSTISNNSPGHSDTVHLSGDPFSTSASTESSSIRSASLRQPQQSQLSKLIERERRMSAESPPKR